MLQAFNPNYAIERSFRIECYLNMEFGSCQIFKETGAWFRSGQAQQFNNRLISNSQFLIPPLTHGLEHSIFVLNDLGLTLINIIPNQINRPCNDVRIFS